MSSKLEIKSRIRSVDSTKKITKAMQLVAASKLKKCKSRMMENREYAGYLRESVDNIMINLFDSSHPYLVKSEGDKVLTIIFTSDMGLCGGYNANEYRMIQDKLKKENPIIVFGCRGAAWLQRRKYNIVESLYNVDEEGYEDLARIAEKALDMFATKEINRIQILYSRFINSVTFEPTLETLLPVINKGEGVVSKQTTIFEPAGETILDELIPMFIKSMMYSFWLETKTSEQGSRQNAMENATENAQELRDKLELAFNQARQAAITQEITEIVGGASALN